MDWLVKLAPTAATLLGGPLAGMAISAIGDALGLKEATKEKITEVLQSGTMTPEQLAALKTAEANLKIKLKELDIKVEEIHAQDRDSARKMQIQNRSWIPAVLTIVTVGGFFLLLVGSATGHYRLEGSDIMMLLLGVLARETAGVYAYWFGSSSGSAQKTEMLKK
jgi:hypothetical protein